jgi:glucose-6-phosphate isomerase
MAISLTETAMNASTDWNRFNKLYCRVPSLGISLDVSRMTFDEGFLESMEAPMAQALAAMERLEKGEIANVDENRMVGHYWLRAPDLAPTRQIADDIKKTVADVKSFAAAVHSGDTAPGKGRRFSRLLSIGIGGSALGPMFVADALGRPSTDRMDVAFIDNTDPDGIALVLERLAGKLDETLCIVMSKSGGTPETRNGMILVAEAYRAAGLSFPKYAVAITMQGSQMDKTATEQGWLARFPMFDWIGGRTSVLSAVGLLPAALQGLDVDGLLEGARVCDEATRSRDMLKNPAALMSLAWHYATGGKGNKDMVVLPYKDGLLLLSRYLQQLIMESIGKQLDLSGRRVEQGLSVYGNKGSTDQHAYVQQLRDGLANFFALFIRVLESGEDREVEPGVTAGDYLHGFLLGTRAALAENGRQSMTLTLPRVDARSVGAVIALFERAVGLYANLLGINAYHQPGVEAGKKAAAAVLALQGKVVAALGAAPQTADQIAAAISQPDNVEAIYLLLTHLAANGRARVAADHDPARATFARA